MEWLLPLLLSLAANGTTPTAPRGAQTDAHGIAWVSIPAGELDMGCSPGDAACGDDELPVHRVRVGTFWMMTTEVTQRQFRSVMGSNPSRFPQCGDTCPVEQVTWEQAGEFCARVGGRLPSEAEWEYAARAGTTTALYTGKLTEHVGKGGPELDAIAWYAGNSAVSYGGAWDCSAWEEKQPASRSCGTHPVGKKKPNAFGLYDMLGNVWEWTQDWYRYRYTGAPADGSARECPPGEYRVLRGGSWTDGAGRLRASARGRTEPGVRDDSIGLRCVRETAVVAAPPAEVPLPFGTRHSDWIDVARFYPVGFSPQGHFAYATYNDGNDTVGEYTDFRFFIQDLRSDAVVFELRYNSLYLKDLNPGGSYRVVPLPEVWKEHADQIQAAMKKFHISPAAPPLTVLPYTTPEGSTLSITAVNGPPDPEEIGHASVITVYAQLEGGKRKRIYHRRPGQSWSVKPAGLLLSPHEKLAAVILVETFYPFEGTAPHRPLVVGCRLDAGF